jgi:hypothetical protein
VPVTDAKSMLDVLSGEMISSGPFLAKKHRVYAIHSEAVSLWANREFDG